MIRTRIAAAVLAVALAGAACAADPSDEGGNGGNTSKGGDTTSLVVKGAPALAAR